MDSRDQSDRDPHVEKDKRLSRMYGKVPSRGDLLHHQLQGRKYFDSGDFALSQAHRSSNAGAVKTGSEHPLRGTISNPLAPVPSSSNVDDADQTPHNGRDAGDMKHASHLHDGATEQKNDSSRDGAGDPELESKV